MILPNNKIVHNIQSSQSLLSTLMRGGLGLMGTPHPMQPEKPLILFEHEACPYSRRVREVMTHLNLDYVSQPSPHKGHVYRDELKERAGKEQVPFLVDENTGDSLLESQDIIDHLFAHYSKKAITPKKFQQFNKDGASVINKGASIVSMMRGVKASHPKKNVTRGRPDQLLELYGFEASPFCRLVREKLSELEIGYINHNVAKEKLRDIGTSNVRLGLGEYRPMKGGKRERIMNEVMGGKIQVPYLIDPNTDVKTFESKEIIDYLQTNYG